MIIDTHSHLYSDAFNADREEVYQRAIAAGLERIYLPAIDSESTAGMLALESAHPETCFAMMGLHPCSVHTGYEQELDHVLHWLDKRDFVAIGEIGLDFYWDTSYR
ncbi:MAG TPA: TatD family hydrolase, partial [Sediminibacterium sp.]|nr:TatD family hydrolase [Sediminibacterium sp.]